MTRRTIGATPRGVTRRGILRGGAATGLAATALGTGLMPRPARAEPTRGGTMRCAKGHGATTDTLDPRTTENGFMIALAYGYNGYLVGIDTDGSFRPEVAESWEAAPDAKAWRFKLRPDVTFHSGRPVTVEDVIASIDLHRGPDSTSAAKPILEGITAITAEGDVVAFELSAGNADFPFVFTDYHLPILPVVDGSPDWRSQDGCGPYRLIEFQPGVVARLERFERDWNDQRGWFDGIEMLSIVDLNARTAALVSGDVDAIDKLDLKTVSLVERDPGVVVHSVAGNQHYTFAMSVNKEPFTDNNVRLALKYAIDRDELVEKILFGYGTVGNDHPIGPNQRFHNDELEQTTYDPDRAKFHLKEAGLDGLSVALSAADAAYPGAVDAAVLYRNSAAAAGIDLEVKRVPNDGYWSDVWMSDPFTAVYWGGRPVEDSMLTMAYSPGAAWNDTFWEDARFTELLEAARAELDEQTRRQMYHEMQAILNQQGGAVIPMFADYVFAIRDNVGTGELASNWDMDGERWMERWWFEG